MHLFKQITSYTPLTEGNGPYSRASLEALNLHIRRWQYKYTSGEITGGAYHEAMTLEHIKVIHTRSLGKEIVTLPPIAEIVNWRVYEDACIRKVYQDEDGKWQETKAVPTLTLNKELPMNEEANAVSTEVSNSTTNQGTIIENSIEAQTNDAVTQLSTELSAGTITQAEFDVLVTEIASDLAKHESVAEPVAEVKEEKFVPTYSLKDKMMDLAFNRALTMIQNHNDRVQVESIIKPLMESTAEGYQPERWLVALRRISKRVSDTSSHFTIARAINTTMSGITLTLNDRLAGHGKGVSTSWDRRVMEKQAELDTATENENWSVADQIRDDLDELVMNQESEQIHGDAYAGTDWTDKALPLDYDQLMDIANDMAMGAQYLYASLNLGNSDRPMQFQVWSRNENAENPEETPIWVSIDNFTDALAELEAANARRDVVNKANASRLANAAIAANADTAKESRKIRDAKDKADRAILAREAIQRAKDKIIADEIQRNLGVVELRLGAYKAGDLSSAELLSHVIDIVNEHDLLTTPIAEKFVTEYCELNEISVPVA